MTTLPWAREVAGLDLTSAEDRAILRGRLGETLRGCAVHRIREYAREAGATAPPTDRHGAVRALAQALIDRASARPPSQP